MYKLAYKQVLLLAYMWFALQELGKQNPDLLQMINSNQEEFLRMINDPAPQGEPDMAALAGAAGVSSLLLQALSGICFVCPVCLCCTSCICLLFSCSCHSDQIGNVFLALLTSSCLLVHKFAS